MMAVWVAQAMWWVAQAMWWEGCAGYVVGLTVIIGLVSVQLVLN